MKTRRFFLVIMAVVAIFTFAASSAMSYSSTNINVAANVDGVETEYQILGVISDQPDPDGWKNWYAEGFKNPVPYTFWGETGTPSPGGNRIVIYAPPNQKLTNAEMNGSGALVDLDLQNGIIQFWIPEYDEESSGECNINLIFEEILSPDLPNPRIERIKDDLFQITFETKNESLVPRVIEFGVNIYALTEKKCWEKKYLRWSWLKKSTSQLLQPGEEYIFTIQFSAKDIWLKDCSYIENRKEPRVSQARWFYPITKWVTTESTGWLPFLPPQT